MTIDEQIRAALERALTALRGHLEEDLRGLAHEVARVAAEERTRAVSEAASAAAADARRQAEAQITQLRETAQRQGEEMRRAAEAQIAEIRRTLQAQLDEVRRSAQQHVDEARRAAQGEVEEARRAGQRGAEEARRAAQAEAEEIANRRLATTRAEAEARMAAAADVARTDALQAELARTSRMLDGIRSIDAARSLGEILEALATAAMEQVDRVAVLVRRQERLRGWSLQGFGTEAEPLEFDLASAGFAAAAVSSGAPVSRAASKDGGEPLPPFAGNASGRHAVALPITVGGEVVAVLYADAPPVNGGATAGCWPASLEILARHAGRALEAVTIERALGLDLPSTVARASHAGVPGPVESDGDDAAAARRYARLLVSEIRMYHEPLVNEGRRSRDLLSRLGGEIDRARRLYEARVPAAIREQDDFFEQELVRTLADGDRSLLGHAS